jgi:hypothetical protein
MAANDVVLGRGDGDREVRRQERFEVVKQSATSPDGHRSTAIGRSSQEVLGS